MGVKLSELVPKKAITFEDLKGKKIAVDASNMLYQFVSSIRQMDGTPLMDSKQRITSHLMGLSTRIPNLIEKGIKPCFVFDGKPPRLKIKEQEEREHRKRVAETKLEQAKEEDNTEAMAKYSKMSTRLSREIMEESKEFLKALGLPVIQAPSESDAQAAFICEKKDVYAVASSDFDTLLFNSPRMITNLTVSQKRKVGGSYINITPEMIELKQALKKLNINQDQLIALGILIGTDYNVGGIKGIGPKTALKLVQQHKTFDKLFKDLNPDFNWKEIYAIFKSMPIMKNYQLKWESPNEDKINEILLDHDFSQERIDKILEKLTGKKKGQNALDKYF
ncbi:MAG: flap endonuclease-1 [Nanoarchaeota archaeon]|nr:flap endonuclease-1 [Nanoarchaeota archaeon]MBU1445140.1 flap endonuclease-1 [Nanoarchaeota archaeon]MBU2406630.1 flap endonuclease-1 [Nanoarchaeota archaeon]MBU2420074.1 flap endonuclease-1 [Nanoarchaeota archaeon]MBU2475567.1 flap endonuclease-1 [Nanoarchaeota archaeon]